MFAGVAVKRLRDLLYPLLLAGAVGLALFGWRAAVPAGSTLTNPAAARMSSCSPPSPRAGSTRSL